MLLCDVNVFVYAHREDVDRHREYRDWLEDVCNGPAAFGVSDLALSGFIRVVTHPKIFVKPTPVAIAVSFVERLRQVPNAVTIAPGVRHFSIFADLCRRTGAKGNHVPDAFFAALAIESGSEWITADRGFARFPKLRWRHPVE